MHFHGGVENQQEGRPTDPLLRFKFVRGLKSEKQHGIEGGAKWRRKDLRNGMEMGTRMGMKEVTRFCGLDGFMTTGAPLQPNARPR